MTDVEFETLQEECRAYVARTSFPPASVDPESDDFSHHGEHAEYGAAAH